MKEIETEREIVELLEISKSFLSFVESKYNNKEISTSDYNRFVASKREFISQTNLLMSN